MTVPGPRSGPRSGRSASPEQPPSAARDEVTDPRDAACRACRTRECCTREVALTVHELASIARTLAVPPTRFAALAPASSHAPEPLRLAATGSAHHLILRRRDGACVFLLHLGSGRKACGLGPLAPAPCRDFPSLAALSPSGQAPPCWRPWTPAELAASTVSATASAAALSRHARTVAAWHEALGPRLFPLDPATALDALLAFADLAP